VLFGGGRFLCRSCHGLQYQSQYESTWSRATSRAQKLRSRLHGSANLLEPFPARPKHMHHRTYQRLRELDARLMGVMPERHPACRRREAQPMAGVKAMGRLNSGPHSGWEDPLPANIRRLPPGTGLEEVAEQAVRLVHGTGWVTC
jgi:hypothetical protein